jgi:hypothetical protein
MLELRSNLALLRFVFLRGSNTSTYDEYKTCFIHRTFKSGS